jgi:ribosomal protein L40E
MGVIVAALPVAEEYLPGRRQCPKCAEYVRREATLCRHCHSKLTALPALKRSGVAALNPVWTLGAFTTGIGVVVEVLALAKVIETWWLGLALIIAGAYMLFRTPRNS